MKAHARARAQGARLSVAAARLHELRAASLLRLANARGMPQPARGRPQRAGRRPAANLAQETDADVAEQLLEVPFWLSTIASSVSDLTGPTWCRLVGNGGPRTQCREANGTRLDHIPPSPLHTLTTLQSRYSSPHPVIPPSIPLPHPPPSTGCVEDQARGVRPRLCAACAATHAAGAGEANEGQRRGCEEVGCGAGVPDRPSCSVAARRNLVFAEHCASHRQQRSVSLSGALLGASASSWATKRLSAGNGRPR